MYPFTQFPAQYSPNQDNIYNHNYSFPDAISNTQDSAPYQSDLYRRTNPHINLNYNYASHSPSYQQQSHLHAPMPLAPQFPPPPPPRQAAPAISHTEHVLYPPVPAPSLLDYYSTSSQMLFPTPSELLTDLATFDTHSRVSDPVVTPAVLPAPEASPSAQVHTDLSELSENGSAATNVNKTESQRKARQRAVAEEIGFTPTDPDTISSHDKKRHYLECVEQYVMYLHEQLHLVATEPLEFERVSTYRGLSSRSIRTLLVHMQNTNKQLHRSTLEEEQVFLNLSEDVMAADGAGPPHRRHSVDIAGIPGYRSAASGSYLMPPPVEDD
ncbi:hypothetical protein BJ138DRAFT_1054046 [Hygrophoropsis aurantiaca]|uniref:Uncharacterized protein n=1 Tax=Hygrophoropsis aurantiaca TaxID=72124 RepID=A0ACB8ARH8_9AGAM|nr:hypothetical protein BJ138DRAFT_1054046 [Hygrophoropsis aurantiaca]